MYIISAIEESINLVDSVMQKGNVYLVSLFNKAQKKGYLYYVTKRLAMGVTTMNNA